jgi:hypothetical protein
MVRINRKGCRFLHRRRVRIGMHEHESREAEGECRLADPGRPADQPGMRDATALVGIKQGAFSLFMTEQSRGFARQPAVPIV